MQSIDDKAVGGRLKEIIPELKYKSKRSFAISIDADPSFFDKIVNGNARLTEVYAQEIEKKHGVNMEWLYTGRGMKYKEIPKNSQAIPEDLLAKYIRQLEEDKVFLKRIIEANLIEISERQRTLQAEIQAVHQWDAQITSGGDKAKEQDSLNHIQKQVSDNRERLSKKNISADNGK